MIQFRNANEMEVGSILDWAAAEGWNPGLDDASAFYAADPSGFFVAAEEEQPVAAISVVNHNDAFAFLGLYIVLPSHRGMGIGHALWQHAISHAGARTVGLDGVPEQQENYVASGFTHAGGTTRFSGSIAAVVCPDIRLAQTSEVAALIDREAHMSDVRKEAYLSAWFSNSENRVTLVGDNGFCTVRKCRSGAKIGPLIAEDSDTATRLIHHAASVFGSDLIIDVPDASAELTEICSQLQMAPSFKTARMYRGTTPVGAGGIFAVGTLELG